MSSTHTAALEGYTNNKYMCIWIHLHKTSACFPLFHTRAAQAARACVRTRHSARRGADAHAHTTMSVVTHKVTITKAVTRASRADAASNTPYLLVFVHAR